MIQQIAEKKNISVEQATAEFKVYADAIFKDLKAIEAFWAETDLTVLQEIVESYAEDEQEYKDVMHERELREQFVNLFKNAYELSHETEQREVGILLEQIIDDVVDKFRDGESLQSLEARMTELFAEFIVLDEKYGVI